MDYDNWKATDPADNDLSYNSPRAQCDAIVAFRKVNGTYSDYRCKVPYEDHNDEELGHAFVMPEPDSGRDY